MICIERVCPDAKDAVNQPASIANSCWAGLHGHVRPSL